MVELAQQRCANHAGREAVARCPGCRRHFCRECITEHDDRVWCTACLARQARPPLARRLRLAALSRLLMLTLALFMLWSAFYLCGRALLAVPADFHEGAYLATIIDRAYNQEP